MKHLLNALIKVASAVGGLISIGIIITIFVAFLILPQMPKIEENADFKLELPFSVYTQDGKLIGEYGKERRVPLSYEQTPKQLINAILSAEDDGFFKHPGIDVKGIIRALLANLQSGSSGQGASTITMQVARNFFLSREKTYSRKLNELFLALQLENKYSKEQILELYLNKIFLGHRAYGFEAAANVYYDKSVSELTLAQMAMLAGLPKAPSLSNPVTNPERARQRRSYVLSRMQQLGYITEEEFTAADMAEISASKHGAQIEFEAPYMAEMVRQQLLGEYGEEIYGSGYKVFTTIDSNLQATSDQMLRNGLIRYDRRHGYRKTQASEEPLNNYGHLQVATVNQINQDSAELSLGDGRLVTLNWDELNWSLVKSKQGRIQPSKASDLLTLDTQVYLEPTENNWRLAQVPQIAGAMITVDPKDGAIKALTGGFDYSLSKFNRAMQAKRQAGSNIKPFIYSAAINKDYRSSSKVSAEPLAFKDSSLKNGVWLPGNYSGKFYGYTTLSDALSKSLNLVSIRLLQSVGVKEGIEYLSRFNFDPKELPRGLALSLGSADITPVEMVSAYAVFANGGYLVEPYFIERIVDRDNKPVPVNTRQKACPYCPVHGASNSDYTITSQQTQRAAKLAIAPANAYVMTNMLRDVVRKGTAVSAKKRLGRADIGGKTGTTNDFKDAWFSGYNHDLVTSVWIGFDQPRTLGKRESATRVALPVWIDFMEQALADKDEYDLPKPDNIRIEEEQIYIVSNRPEYQDESFVLDTIQSKTEQQAEGLF